MRFIYLGVFAAIGAALWLLMFEPLEAPAEPVAIPKELPRYSVTQAAWVRLDAGGRPELRARAAGIDYFADESARLSDLTLDALGGESSPWTMTAPSGKVPPHERRVLLEGEVLAQGEYADEPLHFVTGQLWVDLLRRELSTDAPVVLESRFRRASARGLRADFAGESVQLLDNVQVEYVGGT